MSMKLFDVASMEDYTPGFETKVDIIDVVAMEEDSVEFAMEAEEVAGHISAMQTSVEAADMLANQIAVEEAILSTGNATYGIAQLANVSLQNTAALVGINPERFAISNESMEANPTTALRVSMESATDTFKAIIEKIKAFFSKVYSGIKKMYVKLALMFTNYEKVFKALEEKADNLKDEKKDGVKDVHTEANGKKIVNKSFISLLGDSDKNYKDVLVSTGTVYKIAADVIESKIGDTGAYKVREQMTKGKSTLAGLSNEFNGLPSTTSTDGIVVLTKITGTTIRGEVIKTDDVELSTGQKLVKITYSPFTATAKKDKLESMSKNIKILNIAGIKALIKTGKENADDKVKKEVLDAADEVAKTVEAAISKAKDFTSTASEEKDKTADKSKVESLHSGNLSRLTVAGLRYSSDVLLTYLDRLRTTAFLANINMAQYKTKEA